MLEVQNLLKRYGSQKALDHISFSVSGSEVLGFLGPNGAGKSTTMKIATGYIKADEGRVLINGLAVDESPLEVKRMIGYLPEHNPLYVDMYVKEYLGFVAGLYGIKSAAKDRAVQQTIDRTGLGIEQKKRISALSKGYRQRVGLAAALVHDPKVLILDEPTTGLDPNQIQEIRQVIREVGREKTVLFSSHIMQEVQALCKRVVVIHQGRIVADGPLDALSSDAKGAQILIVEFTTSIDPAVLQSLAQVDSVQDLTGNRYEIKVRKGADARPAIFAAAASKSLPLVSLFEKENNLEQLFKTLTQ